MARFAFMLQLLAGILTGAAPPTFGCRTSGAWDWALASESGPWSGVGRNHGLAAVIGDKVFQQNVCPL
jgi:hypothetical protein